MVLDNLQCCGVRLIWIIVGQGLTALAVGVGGAGFDILLSPIIFLFFSSHIGDGLI